jgi:hypothetical protein
MFIGTSAPFLRRGNGRIRSEPRLRATTTNETQYHRTILSLINRGKGELRGAPQRLAGLTALFTPA